MLSNILKQNIWIKRFINNFQTLDCINLLPMLGNNIFCIKIIRKNKLFRQITYLHIEHNFIRKLVRQNKIFIDYINTKNILADNFTQDLKKSQFVNY